jgi:hypothetical protein
MYGLPCKIVFSQGKPLSVEAPGRSVPIARISYSMGVAGNREADCNRGLRPIKGVANPFLPKYDKYFYNRTKRRETLAKETSLRVHEHIKLLNPS